MNGFYYNHYNVVNGTGKYVDGPYDTLEEAVKVMRDYHPQAVEIDGSAPDVEEDSFDDIDPQQVREELAKSGIVDGKLVDPEALNSTPFIRQVMTDVGAAEPISTLPTTQHPQNRPHTLHPEIPADDRRNYHIRTNDLGAGVPIERFYHNVHAIELLHKLESENRLATPNEQDILSQYVGWGGLPQFFEESNAHYAELKALLSEDEYTAARESTLTAFYTSPVVIRAMYKGLSNLGFQTGNILEPSCGVGNFMGLLPENMENSKMYGVELDSISGRIAQQLYQKNSIAVQGFEKTDLPDSFFDVAIGNVPFGTFKVLDKKYDKYNFLIRQKVSVTSVDQELNTLLYQRMFAEQESYRQHLLTLPPEEILEHAYAYTTREDILLSLEYNDLTDKQCQALLKSPCPLSDVFQAWEKCESSHMEELWSVVEDRANTVIQAAKAKSHREER